MSIDSPILGNLQAAGAMPGERFGFVTAAHFGDPAREHREVRRNAALFDRPHMRVIRLTGGDRVPFLHRMVTSDIASLRAGNGCPSALLTPKGKFIATFHTLALPDSLILLVADCFAEDLVTTLGRFLIIDDAEIVDEAAYGGIVHLAGPAGRDVLERIGGTIDEKTTEGLSRWITVPGLSKRVLAMSHAPTGEDGYDLIAPRAELTTLWTAITSSDDSDAALALPAGFDAYDSLRVEAGNGEPGIDITADLGPIEAGLIRSVSFEKGCYMGQEVVAKMHYRGGPPRRLTSLEISGEELPAPGAPILDGDRTVGQITTSAHAHSLGGRAVALGIVRSRAIDRNRELTTPLGSGGTATVRPVETPFR